MFCSVTRGWSWPESSWTTLTSRRPGACGGRTLQWRSSLISAETSVQYKSNEQVCLTMGWSDGEQIIINVSILLHSYCRKFMVQPRPCLRSERPERRAGPNNFQHSEVNLPASTLLLKFRKKNKQVETILWDSLCGDADEQARGLSHITSSAITSQLLINA